MAQTSPEPNFSIVIPARNMERFIQETLESVFHQTAKHYEVIVIDDGSTDKTCKIAGEFTNRDERFRIVNGLSKGVSAARNLGLSLAKGKFILFLDADDLLHPKALKMLSASLASSDAVGSLAGVQKIDINGRQLSGSDNRLLVPKQNQLAALLRKNFVVNGGALAIRTEIARMCGGYDEDLKNGEDWEFWCRIALNGKLNVVDGPALLFYRQVAQGANFSTRGWAFTRKVPCIQKIATNPSMQEKFGPRLRTMLRARRIDNFWSGVRNNYYYGRTATALLQGLFGLIIFPDSVFRLKLIVRFTRSLFQRTH